MTCPRCNATVELDERGRFRFHHWPRRDVLVPCFASERAPSELDERGRMRAEADR